jgi:ankyrin repeat protein
MALDMNPIFSAIERGDQATVKRLLRSGKGSLDSTNEEGNTPLHEAVRRCDYDMVATLIKLGANVNAKGEYGNTPLNYAVDRDCLPEIPELLLTSGADLEIRNLLGETPLFRAALGNPDIAEVLLRSGATLDLNSAILLKRIDKVQQLLNESAPFSRVALIPDQLLMHAVLVRYSGPRKLDHQLSYCGGPGKG